MNSKFLTVAATTLLLCACSNKPHPPPLKSIATPPLGINATGIDRVLVHTDGLEIGALLEFINQVKVDLHTAGIKVVEYGDTTTLYIPTDRYFIFDTPELNEKQSLGLYSIAKFVLLHPKADISIAGFSDDVGTKSHKLTLSTHRAEAFKAFLWAQGIDVNRITAEGFGEKFDIASNDTVLGSTMNRRVEIQLSL